MCCKFDLKLKVTARIKCVNELINSYFIVYWIMLMNCVLRKWHFQLPSVNILFDFQLFSMKGRRTQRDTLSSYIVIHFRFLLLRKNIEFNIT